MKVTVRITEILPLESGVTQEGRDWTRRTFAGQTVGLDDIILAFEVSSATQQETLEAMEVGQRCEVTFYLSSRRHNDGKRTRYFTSLRATDIVKL